MTCGHIVTLLINKPPGKMTLPHKMTLFLLWLNELKSCELFNWFLFTWARFKVNQDNKPDRMIKLSV